MSCLEKFALSIPNIKERLLIIISDANYREYQAISNSLQSDIPIYLSKDTTLSTILKEENPLSPGNSFCNREDICSMAPFPQKPVREFSDT